MSYSDLKGHDTHPDRTNLAVSLVLSNKTDQSEWSDQQRRQELLSITGLIKVQATKIKMLDEIDKDQS